MGNFPLSKSAVSKLGELIWQIEELEESENALMFSYLTSSSLYSKPLSDFFNSLEKLSSLELQGADCIYIGLSSWIVIGLTKPSLSFNYNLWHLFSSDSNSKSTLDYVL